MDQTDRQQTSWHRYQRSQRYYSEGDSNCYGHINGLEPVDQSWFSENFDQMDSSQQCDLTERLTHQTLSDMQGSSGLSINEPDPWSHLNLMTQNQDGNVPFTGFPTSEAYTTPSYQSIYPWTEPFPTYDPPLVFHNGYQQMHTRLTPSSPYPENLIIRNIPEEVDTYSGNQFFLDRETAPVRPSPK
jgi:hypothetical protein